MSCDSHVIITIIGTIFLETVKTLAAELCLRVVHLEQIKFNRASVAHLSYLQSRGKRYFLRSSGVRHRKWIRLGVKLPDFTVGMSSHCIIRGYSLSLASVKREDETPPSLPERRFLAAILLNDDVCGSCDDDDSLNNDCARFDRGFGTAIHDVRVLHSSLVA